jgi:hypothetical protein
MRLRARDVPGKMKQHWLFCPACCENNQGGTDANGRTILIAKVGFEMQPIAASVWAPASDRKVYVVWIAVVWAAVLAGFGLDIVRYLGEVPAPPPILHIHAAVYVIWLALVTLQILWVEVGQVRRHKQLGWLTVGVSALMVPLGLAAAFVDQVRQVAQPDYAPQFLSLEFEEVIAFSTFMIGGVIYRRRPAAHKRLMLLAAVAISDAGFARIMKMDVPGMFGWWLQYFWGIFLILIAMGAWDLWRRRRIHPALLFGAAVLWSGEIIATLLNFSPGWRGLMVRLVSAWGYAG